MEQEPRICPLCGSPVRLFYINFTEKLLMCEDSNCDFPFGYEELQVVIDESELRENFDTASSISLGPYVGVSAASSVVSTAAWSDIEKLNRIYESEDNVADSRLSITSNAVREQKERRKTQQEIQKNLENIKKLNTELNILKHVDRGTIEKDNWLKNLMTLQGVSGRQLLKEDEIEKLKKTEPDFGMGELKINISTEPNDNGLINIEITNEDSRYEDENHFVERHENKIQIQFDEIDENDHNDDLGEYLNDKKNNLANNQEAVTLNESFNTNSNIQETVEIENAVNNYINLEEIQSNNTLPELNIDINEINNFVMDSEIDYADTNLVDVKTVVINDSNVTLIQLKGATQDINSQNETEIIEADIQTDSTNASKHTSIPANEVNEENTDKSKNIDAQNEITESHDASSNNPNEEETKDVVNDKCIESSKLETKVSKTSDINKEINLLHEIEKQQNNYELRGSSNIKKKNTNSDKVNDSCTKYGMNTKSSKFEEEHNQQTQKDKSTKSDFNDSNESIDLMDTSKESVEKVKIPKKIGKSKKGQRGLNQPLRRSYRLSK